MFLILSDEIFHKIAHFFPFDYILELPVIQIYLWYDFEKTEIWKFQFIIEFQFIKDTFQGQGMTCMSLFYT